MCEMQARMDSANMAGEDVSTVQNVLLASTEREGEEMKTCIKCHEAFPLTDQFFARRSNSRDGFRHDCKACVRERTALWYQRNRQDQLQKMKERRIINIETVLAKKREYNKKNRDMMVIKCRNYYSENRDKVLSQMKDHRLRNKETINQKRRDSFPKYAERVKRYKINNREKMRETQNRYCANRRQTDPEYKMLSNIRTRIAIAIRNTKSHKITGTTKLIGCTIAELRKHLERQFLPGMSWENWSRTGWHIDHIVPCACFDLSFPNQQMECFNYKNLRPVWAVDNLKKGAKLIRPFQPFLAMAI